MTTTAASAGRTGTTAVTTVLCDLDGVVWLAGRAIPGAPRAVERLRDAGCRVLFVTNNSAAVIARQEAALAAIGIPAEGDVLTSAGAAATLVNPGERVLVCGGPGVVEACEAAGARVVSGAPCDVVMVGFHREFDYDRMRIAADAIRGGARLIGTNDDATYPTPDGPIPGGGAILAAVVVASGATPEIAGKPHRPMAELVRRAIGDGFDPEATVMIGDRPSTDGLFAGVIGCRYAIVRSGVTAPGEPVDVEAWFDAGDLAGVAARILAADASGD